MSTVTTTTYKCDLCEGEVGEKRDIVHLERYRFDDDEGEHVRNEIIKLDICELCLNKYAIKAKEMTDKR